MDIVELPSNPPENLEAVNRLSQAEKVGRLHDIAATFVNEANQVLPEFVMSGDQLLQGAAATTLRLLTSLQALSIHLDSTSIQLQNEARMLQHKAIQSNPDSEEKP